MTTDVVVRSDAAALEADPVGYMAVVLHRAKGWLSEAQNIARETGLDRTLISRIASGLHAPDDTKQKIADALDRPVADVFPDNGNSEAAA